MQTYDPEIKESLNYQSFHFLTSTPLLIPDITVYLNDSPLILVLDNVLTSNECQELTEIFHDSSTNIRQGNYNRKKLIINCEELSQLFLHRVSSYLSHSLTSYGGTNCHLSNSLDDPKYCWLLDVINPAWRLVKGDLNSKLPLHFDGSYVKSVDYRSIYTVIVYLADSDGDTRFYHQLPHSNNANSNGKKYFDVTPKQGRFVIFHQSIEHEGLINTNDYKYFMRSELMYRRQEPLEQDSDREAMIKYQKAKECFFTNANESERLEIQAFQLSPTLEDLILNV